MVSGGPSSEKFEAGQDEALRLSARALRRVPGGEDLANELEALFARVVTKSGMRSGFNYKDLDTEAPAPATGVTVYSYGGSLKAVKADGTRTTLF